MLNKVALITGGSSGIGAEFARQFARMGYNLLLVSNQSEQLEEIKMKIAEIEPSVTCLTLYKDLTDETAPDDVLKYCEANGVVVDVLVNNAGIFTFKELIDHTERQLSLYFDLHIKATTRLSLLFGRMMAERRYGYILNMSSMSCWMPMPGIGMYAATKAYLRVFSRSLYLELKESGVSVMVACPGGIATDLFGLPKNLQKLGVTLGALSTPESFVRGAIKRLFKKKKQYINGFVNRVAIVFVALLPTRVRLVVKHKLLDKRNDA